MRDVGAGTPEREGHVPVRNESPLTPNTTRRPTFTSAVLPEEPAPWRDRASRGINRAGMAIALALAILTFGLLAVRGLYDGRVYPQVVVAGIDLGGMTDTEARDVLQSRAALVEHGIVTFARNGQTWQPALRDLGISVDIDATLEAAWAVGRQEDAWSRLTATTAIIGDVSTLPLAMVVDENRMEQWFLAVDSDLGVPPHDAYLIVENGKVSIVPEVDGTVVDRVTAQQQVLSAISVLQPVTFDLPTLQKISTVHSGDLQIALEQLQRALANPVTVTFGNETWSLSGAELGQFVIQTIDPAKTGADAVTVGLDIKALSKYLANAFATDVNRDTIDARVAWGAEGLYSVTYSVNGIKVKPTSFAQDVSASFFSDHHTVEVPVSVITPEIDSDNLGALGITTELGTGSSNFDGSDDGRSTNAVGSEARSATAAAAQGRSKITRCTGSPASSMASTAR